ncbi:MAG: hypothetical protein HYZ02_00290, partial [Candidatus Levybacteria bacterium]|nr:hypothetical protein [Candidatus Levybacteria bacterium]
TKELNTTKQLIKKYNIELVFIGDLERQKYPNLNEQKFESLGEVVFQAYETRIYKLTN